MEAIILSKMFLGLYSSLAIAVEAGLIDEAASKGTVPILLGVVALLIRMISAKDTASSQIAKEYRQDQKEARMEYRDLSERSIKATQEATRSIEMQTQAIIQLERSTRERQENLVGVINAFMIQIGKQK